MPGKRRRTLRSVFETLLIRAFSQRPVRTKRWELLDYPPSDHICLVLDGLLTQSNDYHLANRLRDALAQTEGSAVPPAVYAFNYSDDERGYDFRDTFTSIDSHVERLVKVLLELSPRTRVMIAAYSLGGAVALLALERLVQRTSVNWVRQRITSVVLLQPAIHGCRELATVLRAGFLKRVVDKVARKMPIAAHDLVGFSGIPMIAFALGSATSAESTRAQQMLDQLLHLKIATTVFYNRRDGIAPYVPLANRRLQEIEVKRSDYSKRHDKYTAHFALPDVELVQRSLYHISKPFVWP